MIVFDQRSEKVNNNYEYSCHDLIYITVDRVVIGFVHQVTVGEYSMVLNCFYVQKTFNSFVELYNYYTGIGYKFNVVTKA